MDREAFLNLLAERLKRPRMTSPPPRDVRGVPEFYRERPLAEGASAEGASAEGASAEGASPEKDLAKRFKAVRRTLGLLESNPRHPSLQTHIFRSLTGPQDEEVFEAYAEHQTPAAYRVFWYYGPAKGHITILAITPHP